MVSGVAARASQAARILNVLSMVVVILGGLSALATFLVFWIGSANEGNGLVGFIGGAFFAAATLVITAVYWAFIQVASVVASYVGVKVDA